MTGCAIGSIGVVLSVSVAAPATQNAAGFAALTFTKVAALLSFPSFGGVAAVVSNTPLETGEECKSQGSINWGSVPLNGLYTEEDPGHLIMLSGLNGAQKGVDLSFELVYPNGAIRYLRGFVTTYTENPGDSGTNMMMDTAIELNFEPIRVVAP